MKRVLITGAYGFIGRHCLPLLEKAGYEIHAISSSPRTALGAEICHNLDILAPGVAEELIEQVRPTHLLHLAWYTNPGKYWIARENLSWVEASLRLLRAFSLNEGSRIVMAGSCAEYNWEYGYCAEGVTPLSSPTVYSACKNALQDMLSNYARQYDLSSAWGRIFFLYGPHEHPSRLVSSVIHSILKGEPALCSSGEQVRDFLHVADVASAFVTLLSSSIQGPVNIASGKPMSVKDVVEKIASKLERPELLKLGSRPTAPQEPPLLLADVRRLKNELEWQPSFDIERGLDVTIAWWRSQIK